MSIDKRKDYTSLSLKDFKLLALDIDGTLLNGGYELTQRTRRALKLAMDKGLKVTVATGRFYLSAVRIARLIPINVPMVVNDGALIKDVYTGKTIFEQPIPLELAKEILELISRYPNFKIQIFMEKKKIYAGRNYISMQLWRFFRFRHKYSIKNSINYMRDFIFVPVQNTINIEGAKKVLKHPPSKIVLYGNESELQHFENKIKNKYKDEIFLTSALSGCLDVLSGQISKAKGLAALARILGIKQNEIIAIGDNYNDMEMLNYAGLGVAMGNAPRIVKEKADIVIASNNNDGVAQFIETLL